MNRSFFALLSAALLVSVPLANPAGAQTRPTAAQAQAAMTDPAIRARIMAQVKNSGMSQDQIRSQLKSMGYSDDVINQLLGGAGVDTTAALSDDVFAAVRALGIMDSTAVDSLRRPFMMRKLARVRADSALLDTLGIAIQNDSVRAAIKRVLSSPAARRVGADSGFTLFGRDVFERQTTQFDAAVNGPLPPDYRIGFGDQFTLVLTGDVERTEEMTVTRDGLVFLRDVGQVPTANLTFEQLRATLADRLGRVYSGVKSGTTRFSVLPTRVGTNQVFVLGDVRSPNAYQVSRLGTVLTALYAAGGPNDNGDARAIDVKRSNKVIATMDLYDYLLSGSSSSDVRLENGDVVFVRPRGPRVRVSGAVVRPATYELKMGESLADAIRMSGGFRPEADRRRVQIERIVAPTSRTESGSDKEVIDITSPLLATGYGPAQRMESGDVVHVFTVAPNLTNRIEVQGNVWSPSRIAFGPEMRLSDALARAGGIKPDTYLEAVQISRLAPDSTRHMVRVGLRPDGTPADNIALAPNDIIHVYSQTEFRTARYVTVGGAVKDPGKQIPYQEGMTLRDLVMLGGGLQESALLTEAEIARLPESRANGVTATTIRVPLDSTYLFERGSDGKYLGPPGIPAPIARAPEVLLKPYDAVSILRQPDFEYQRTVTIAGRVKYAGQYSLKTKTERLSDLLVRAGGLTADAYPAGISFVRQRDTSGAVGNDLIGSLRNRADRIGIDLPRVLRNPNDVDNILLVDGDSIFIPPYNPIVTVRGAVNSPASAVAFVQGADINYYIRAAGGGSVKADDGRAYVFQPNGKVETKHRTGIFFTSTPKPEAGSIVVVPEKDPNDKHDWVAAAQTGLSLLASLVTVAVLVKK